MSKTRIPILTAALGLGLALVAGQAAAIPLFSPYTNFEDNDVDFLVDNDGNGTIDVGDRLTGVFVIEGVSGSGNSYEPRNDLGVQLSGVFDLAITGKSSASGGGFNFTFGPANSGGVLGTDAMVRLWTDTSPDFNVNSAAVSCVSLSDCHDVAGLGADSDSSPFLTLGFSGDPDEAWRAFGLADDPSAVLGKSPSSQLGDFNFALSILANNTGVDLGLVPCSISVGCSGDSAGDGFIGFVGSGTINGGLGLPDGLVNDGAFGTSDFQGTVRVLPAPGALALFVAGIGLIGFGLRIRRSRGGSRDVGSRA